MYEIQDRNKNTLKFRLFKDSDLGFDEHEMDCDEESSDAEFKCESETDAQDEDVESDESMIDSFV